LYSKGILWVEGSSVSSPVSEEVTQMAEALAASASSATPLLQKQHLQQHLLCFCMSQTCMSFCKHDPVVAYAAWP